MTQEACQRRYRPDAQDKDPFGLQDGIDRSLKSFPVQPVTGLAKLFHICMKDHRHHILVAKTVICYFDSLDTGQAVQDHFLHGFLHFRVTLVTQLHREADHRGFGYAHGLTQLAGGHKGRFVIGLRNIFGNGPLALGKAGPLRLQKHQDVVVHM